jgi:hypothetical protein
MKRRDIIKGMASLPLLGLINPLDSVFASMPEKFKKKRLVIDTHVETWNFDSRFPFKHPENPNLKVAIEAQLKTR